VAEEEGKGRLSFYVDVGGNFTPSQKPKKERLSKEERQKYKEEKSGEKEGRKMSKDRKKEENKLAKATE
jgi:hypothetical protein